MCLVLGLLKRSSSPKTAVVSGWIQSEVKTFFTAGADVVLKAWFPLGGILRVDEIFSLFHGFQMELIRKNQRNSFVRAENFAWWKSG